jgi:hypothetical protein
MMPEYVLICSFDSVGNFIAYLKLVRNTKTIWE